MSIEYRTSLEKFLTDKANRVFKEQRITVDIWEKVPWLRGLPVGGKYWWESGRGEITIMFPSQKEMEETPEEYILAILSHELGHAEQRVATKRRGPMPPPIEADAWLRGAKYAVALGVKDQYYQLFTRVASIDIGEDLRRVRTQIEELLGL